MKRKFVLLALSLALLMPSVSVQASDFRGGLETGELSVSSDELRIVIDEIIQRIIERYGSLYLFDDFTHTLTAERFIGDYLYVDIRISVYMTLTRHPRYNPFVLGLREALANENDEFNRSVIEREMHHFISSTEVYYNIPISSSFSYTISFPNPQGARIIDLSNYNLYHRSSSDGEIYLTPETEVVGVEDFDYVFGLGIDIASEFIQRAHEARHAPIPMMNGGFYRNHQAASWARVMAYRPQEIPNIEVPGTNCANFVSHALHAGGIPTSSAWRPAPIWGQTWPSDHWMRTGWHGNGGVTTYLRSQVMFHRTSFMHNAIPGSIVFWTGRSHVAMVVHNDGTKITFAENGAIQSSNSSWSPQSNVSVVFYVPSDWILWDGGGWWR